MIEEPTRPRSPFLQFLKSHGEKAALGVVVLVGLLFLVLGWNGRFAEGEELEERIDQLLVGLEKGAVNPSPPVDLPLPRDGAIPPAEGGPVWAASLKTNLVPRLKPKKPRIVSRKILPRVSWSAAEPQPYTVTLSWVVEPYSKAEQAERKKKLGKYEREEFPELDAMIIERALAGSAEFQVVRVAEPEERSFTDTTVNVKQSYVYRLTPRGVDRPVVEPDRMVMAAPVVVPGIWKLSFNGPNDGEGVYVEIMKVDRKHGRVTVKKFHKVGSRIGWWSHGDEEPTPDHYINREGDPLKVNLDTGITLEAVERMTTSIKVVRCRRIANPNAVLHEDETVDRPASTYRIVLREDGTRRVVHHPRLENRDERCRRHRK